MIILMCTTCVNFLKLVQYILFLSHKGSVESEVREESVEEVHDESDDEYNVYDHLDTVPIKMPTPLSWQDYMYTPTQISVHGMENKGPLRPIDQKPNMRGDPDYDDLSPNQQAKRDLDQFYEYQAKVLAETSARTPKKIKTRVWTSTKSGKPSKFDFTSELKEVTQRRKEKRRDIYKSPDPTTRETYVPPPQKREQEVGLNLTPKRVNITYKEGETINPPSLNLSPNQSNESHVSVESTQSSHKSWPVDNLLSKFQNFPAPPPPSVPQQTLRNHASASPFRPISSRASSPRTSTPIHNPTPHNSPSHTPTHKSNKSGHEGSLSRNSCGSQNSSVYQAKIDSLQDQIQTLLNQSAEKEDKLQRMESELEETKRQMKELINIYKQEQAKKTIQSEIPKSKRHAEKTHFEEEKSQFFLHKPEPVRPQPTFQHQSHLPTQSEAPQKPQFPPPPPVPLEPRVYVQSQNNPN